MKKPVLFILIAFIVGLFCSCGLYKEPCEGVGSVNVDTEKNT
tara:strand:+ start:304 stop:429 length:126 start_codon:yes stop_codon:yes gene_type:complete